MLASSVAASSSTTFNADRSVKDAERIINSPAFECCDGINYGKETDKLYMTNSKMNSVRVSDMNADTMQRPWKNIVSIL